MGNCNKQCTDTHELYVNTISEDNPLKEKETCNKIQKHIP
jgi:hypothetical protein